MGIDKTLPSVQNKSLQWSSKYNSYDYSCVTYNALHTLVALGLEYIRVTVFRRFCDIFSCFTAMFILVLHSVIKYLILFTHLFHISLAWQ